MSSFKMARMAGAFGADERIAALEAENVRLKVELAAACGTRNRYASDKVALRGQLEATQIALKAAEVEIKELRAAHNLGPVMLSAIATKNKELAEAEQARAEAAEKQVEVLLRDEREAHLPRIDRLQKQVEALRAERRDLQLFLKETREALIRTKDRKDPSSVREEKLLEALRLALKAISSALSDTGPEFVEATSRQIEALLASGQAEGEKG